MIVAVVMVLQRLEGLSDREAVELKPPRRDHKEKPKGRDEVGRDERAVGEHRGRTRKNT